MDDFSKWTTYLVQMGRGIDEFGRIIHPRLPPAYFSNGSQRHSSKVLYLWNPEGLRRGCREAGLVFNVYQGSAQDTSQAGRNGEVRPIAQDQTVFEEAGLVKAEKAAGKKPVVTVTSVSLSGFTGGPTRVRSPSASLPPGQILLRPRQTDRSCVQLVGESAGLVFDPKKRGNKQGYKKQHND